MFRSMASPLARLTDVAEGQWGLVTLQQARTADVGWRSLTRLVDAGLLERVAHGVYRVRGAPQAEHLDLRAAWLQLDPRRPAWQRLDDRGVAVVSHTSAARLYGVGDLRADVHEFTIPHRRQTRRPDVRLHRGRVPPEQRILVAGLPTTRAGWMIGQLLADHIDPDAVAQIAREVLEGVLDYPGHVAESLAPYAQRFGYRRGDGIALLDEFLRRAGAPERQLLVAEAEQGWRSDPTR
jgi:Transcriptional regulator, AbiEi antitoxin